MGPVGACNPAAVQPARDDALLGGLVNGMRCGIVAIDREHRVVMVNDVGRQILDLPHCPSPGTPVSQALNGHPQLARLLVESFDMASLPNRAELDLHPGSARAKTIGFTMSLIPGTSAAPAGVAVFFKDLTQIEHREEQERLRDRLAALGQMAASLAHEIRNPLASIEVSCALLKRRAGEDAESLRLLEKVTREVRRLNDTINSSLEFVRPLTLRRELHDLHQLLDAAIDVALTRAGEPGAAIVREYSPGIDPFLMDRVQLRRVFANLVINAVEAMSHRGTIHVETELIPAPSSSSVPYSPDGSGKPDPWECETFAVVRVSDDGPGIPPEERDKIFYPFYTTKQRGSGVGLSNVRKIVDSHRGLIDVDRSPCGGARFTVRLPMARGAEENRR